MHLKQIESEAFHLSKIERATLAQKLLLNLDSPSEDEINTDWLLEACHRAEIWIKALLNQYRLKQLDVMHRLYSESKRPGLSALYLTEFESVNALQHSPLTGRQ